MSLNIKKIGLRIRHYRQSQGISQRQLALLIYPHYQNPRAGQTTLSRIERGLRDDFGIEELQRYAEALKVPLVSLLQDEPAALDEAAWPKKLAQRYALLLPRQKKVILDLIDSMVQEP